MMEQNAMLILLPYRYGETWVFDDDAVGLKKEPFVLGIPEMIDVMVNKIPNANDGFRLIFSTAPFPLYGAELKWIRAEYGGNWYKLVKMRSEEGLIDPPEPMEGWLCPNLYKYFVQAPDAIYTKAEPM